MGRAFRVFWAAVRDCFDEFLLLAACNVIWAVLSVPLIAFALFTLQEGASLFASAAVLLAVLPMGPASAGLAALAHRISEGRTISFRDFFAAMRRYARISWLVMGLWMFGLLIILFDIAFYARIENLFGAVLSGLWLYLLVIWLAIQIYLFPLIMLQERHDLRLLVRNTLIMTMGRPIFTLTTTLLMSVVLVVSYTLLAPLFLATISLLAVWGMRAATTLIEEEKARREAKSATTTGPVQEQGRRGQVRPK